MFKTIGCALLLVWAGFAQAGTATVAAAATLRYALEDMAPRFRQATGHTLKVAYGSSGNFYSQIKQGAPFDVFLSADMVFPQKLVAEKLATPPVHAYAEGRLVLLVPNKSPLKADGSLQDLAAALKDGRLSKLAIANQKNNRRSKIPEQQRFGFKRANAIDLPRNGIGFTQPNRLETRKRKS